MELPWLAPYRVTYVGLAHAVRSQKVFCRPQCHGVGVQVRTTWYNLVEEGINRIIKQEHRKAGNTRVRYW